MDKQEHGQIIIEISKILKVFSNEDTKINRYLPTTRLAGRAGIFASSIKGFTTIEKELTLSRIKILYNEAGIEHFTFNKIIYPWLESKGLCHKKDQNGSIIFISTIYSYSNLLESVVDIFDESVEDEARNIELAIHDLYKYCSDLPRGLNESKQFISLKYDEATADIVIDIVKAYHVLTINKVGPNDDFLLYSERLWKKLDHKMLHALPSFKPDDKAFIESIILRVKDQQGYPEDLLVNEAKRYHSEHLLNFSIHVGLLNRTAVIVKNGTKKYFLTTPHFYSQVEEEFGADACDKVKLFLDSIRHGQYYGDDATGRIRSPEALLQSFIDRGYLSGCSAILTDYTMAEKAGIIKVCKGYSYKDTSMHMVQKDVIEKTYEIIKYKEIKSMNSMPINSFDTEGSFSSVQENRASLAELPGEMAEAEREMINSLREG